MKKSVVDFIFLSSTIITAVMVLLGTCYFMFFDALFWNVALPTASYVLRNSNKYIPPNSIERDNIKKDFQVSWASHPDIDDFADIVPPCAIDEASNKANVNDDDEHDLCLKQNQSNALADVFFVYPTGYFGLELNDPLYSNWITSPMASTGWFLGGVASAIHSGIFNRIGRIYSPRYRQVSGGAYLLQFSDNELDQRLFEQAFDIAFSDIEKSFDAFLAERQERRSRLGKNVRLPIILAGHSQGSTMLAKLIKKRIAGTELEKDLVAAYLIGSSIRKDDTGLPTCNGPDDIGCVIGYNAFYPHGRPHLSLFPAHAADDKDKTNPIICINPLSWRNDEQLVNKEENRGSRPMRPPIQAILTGSIMESLVPQKFSAQCINGYVYTNYLSHYDDKFIGFLVGPMFPGLNLHGAESNLFYVSTRKNAERRLQKFQHHTNQ